jgi:hypothetical protein
VDIFDGSSGRWSTANLSVARSGLAATSLPNQGLAFFSSSSGSNVVDIFDGRSARWSTAELSVPSFAATSLPNQGLAIFVGNGL